MSTEEEVIQKLVADVTAMQEALVEVREDLQAQRRSGMRDRLLSVAVAIGKNRDISVAESIDMARDLITRISMIPDVEIDALFGPEEAGEAEEAQTEAEARAAAIAEQDANAAALASEPAESTGTPTEQP